MHALEIAVLEFFICPHEIIQLPAIAKISEQFTLIG